MKFKHLTINCQLFSYSVILSFILFFSSPLKAQVAIGSQNPPHSFSVLELIAKEKTGGLRLPQLKTSEREALNSQLTGNDKAKGLVVFDTDLNCMELWNGSEWISMCSDVLPADCSSTVFPVLQSSYTLCAGATFSDLTAAVGGKESWYDAATGGVAHANTDLLVSGATYYAEESVGACVSPTRAPVSVTLGDCSTAPAGGNVTTFTNVMYDFQHQTLEAYASGGMTTGYQWQVSEDNSAFNDIAGAPNSNFYTVPAHFADSYFAPAYKADSLYFRCILSNSKGSTTSSSLNILFISTEDANGNPKGNYGIDPATGIRYLTIQTTNTNFPSGTMKIALLNLGQSQNFDGSYNNDAGDLGDFYQWGRVADGHQKTVWTKGANHINTINPMTGDANATSLAVPTGSQTYDATGQIQAGSYGYGNFITTSAAPYCWDNGNTNLWGNGDTGARATSDISLSSWTYPNYQANNPCPGNWSVPSRWNFMDIYNGTGTDASPSSSNYTGTVNKWSWRAASTTYAIGGAIITNANGEKVFMPAAGYRSYVNGTFTAVGTDGYYWSSSIGSAVSSSNMYFNGSLVTPGGYASNRPSGYSVRCISE